MQHGSMPRVLSRLVRSGPPLPPSQLLDHLSLYYEYGKICHCVEEMGWTGRLTHTTFVVTYCNLRLY